VPGTVEERIKEVVSATFNVPLGEIERHTTQADIPAWDSIGHANLLLSLEEEFGVTLSDDVMPTLTSMTRLTKYFSELAEQPE